MLIHVAAAASYVPRQNWTTMVGTIKPAASTSRSINFTLMPRRVDHIGVSGPPGRLLQVAVQRTAVRVFGGHVSAYALECDCLCGSERCKAAIAESPRSRARGLPLAESSRCVRHCPGRARWCSSRRTSARRSSQAGQRARCRARCTSSVPSTFCASSPKRSSRALRPHKRVPKFVVTSGWRSALSTEVGGAGFLKCQLNPASRASLMSTSFP
jgi:hypothetical protein